MQDVGLLVADRGVAVNVLESADAAHQFVDVEAVLWWKGQRHHNARISLIGIEPLNQFFHFCPRNRRLDPDHLRTDPQQRHVLHLFIGINLARPVGPFIIIQWKNNT